MATYELSHQRDHGRAFGARRINYVEQVERAIRRNFSNEHLSLLEIARELNFKSRTLQYHLKNNGTSFQKIYDLVRLDILIDYLTHSDASVSEIAQILHFSDRTATSRFAKLKTGKTPSEIRKFNLGQLDRALQHEHSS